MAAPIATVLVAVDAETSGLVQATGKATAALGGLGKSQQNVAKTSSGASQALLALSGGIQDLPYGIRGVTNNFEFFSTQMVNLTRNAGGFSNALKALVGAMTGPAGILIGISAVTASLPLLQNLFSDSAKSAKGFTSALEDMVKVTSELDDVKFGLDPDQVRRTIDAIDAELRALTPAGVPSGAFGAFGAGPVIGRVPGAALTKEDKQRIEDNKQILKYLTEQKTILEGQLRVAERLKAEGLTGIKGGGRVPGRPDAVISPFSDTRLALFNELAAGLEDFKDLPGYINTENEVWTQRITTASEDLLELQAGLERINAGSLIQLDNQFEKLGASVLTDFEGALTESVAGLILFGDTLGDTLKNFGRRAAGGLLGGLVNLGLNFVPFGGVAKTVASAFGLNIGLGQLGISTQQETTNANGPVIGSFGQFT